MYWSGPLAAEGKDQKTIIYKYFYRSTTSGRELKENLASIRSSVLDQLSDGSDRLRIPIVSQYSDHSSPSQFWGIISSTLMEVFLHEGSLRPSSQHTHTQPPNTHDISKQVFSYPIHVDPDTGHQPERAGL